MTYWCHHYEPNQEAHDTDEQQQQLPAVASSDQVRVQVRHRRHQGLQAHELGDESVLHASAHAAAKSPSVCVCGYLRVQPQHDDHEEEADGPELRHRHHGYGSGVGDEGKAGPFKDKATRDKIR